jgi:hypothetical protein
MFRTDQPRQAVFRSALTRHTNLEDQNHSDVFFIGLGDQFDDDRRLVREAASAPRAQTHLAATVNLAIRRLGSTARIWRHDSRSTLRDWPKA